MTDFSTSPIALLPPIVALSMAILSRRVLLALGIGITLGALLLFDFSASDSAQYIQGKVFDIFVEDGAINSWNMSIIAFLLLLGMMTALLTLSGGSRAFADWAQRRIKNKRGALLLASFLGVFIFIDDYFNSLAVGSIARPVTDRFGVSRAKLAYVIDSTAAPMCVLMPASSWGAYIMTIVSGILLSHGITEYSPLGAYLALVPMNFYAIFALLMVFVMAIFKLDIGSMKKHERSVESGLGRDDNAIDLKEELEISESKHGQVMDLISPIVTLVIATVAAMIYTGAEVLAEEHRGFSILGAFENTNVGQSLVYGAVLSLVVALIRVVRQRIAVTEIVHALWVGAKSMSGAILILVFAWTIGAVIKDIKTGTYLASLVQDSINPQWLPVILFVLSGLMAFATGTSWGTFGIMLPIAGDVAATADITLMLPMLSAVLAGSVFGDHCSPISDTTILSSTGARCRHIDHVSTQLPYALIVAFVSAFGYVVLGVSKSLVISFFATTIVFIAVCYVMYLVTKNGGRSDKRVMA